MKSRYFPAIALALLTLASCTPGDADVRVRRIPRGLAPEECWPSADEVIFSDTNISDNTVRVRSLWNRDSLYFLFEVDDRNLWATQTEHDDKLLYLDDMCEVLLDPRMDRGELWLEDDIIYHVNLLGTVKDDRGEPGGGKDVGWNGKAATSVTLAGVLNADSLAIGYSVRFAIPWSEIGRRPRKGLRLGINLGCGDRDSLQTSKRLFFYRYYYPTRTPSSFACLALEGE